MAFVRLILAGLIAVSVAIAPATNAAAVSTSSAEMTMADQTDMPCCPTPDNAKGSVACAFKCLGFVAAMFPAPSPLVIDANGSPTSFSDRTLRDHISPPTHPPPI